MGGIDEIKIDFIRNGKWDKGIQIYVLWSLCSSVFSTQISDKRPYSSRDARLVSGTLSGICATSRVGRTSRSSWRPWELNTIIRVSLSDGRWPSTEQFEFYYHSFLQPVKTTSITLGYICGGNMPRIRWNRAGKWPSRRPGSMLWTSCAAIRWRHNARRSSCTTSWATIPSLHSKSILSCTQPMRQRPNSRRPPCPPSSAPRRRM